VRRSLDILRQLAGPTVFEIDEATDPQYPDRTTSPQLPEFFTQQPVKGWQNRQSDWRHG
jgi:hypothetical protein